MEGILGLGFRLRSFDACLDVLDSEMALHALPGHAGAASGTEAVGNAVAHPDRGVARGVVFEGEERRVPGSRTEVRVALGGGCESWCVWYDAAHELVSAVVEPQLGCTLARRPSGGRQYQQHVVQKDAVRPSRRIGVYGL